MPATQTRTSQKRPKRPPPRKPPAKRKAAAKSRVKPKVNGKANGKATLNGSLKVRKPKRKAELREHAIPILDTPVSRMNGRARAVSKPSPYFKARGCALYHGDCLELLAAKEAGSVDMIFADPPYGLSNGGMSCHAGKRVSVNKGDWDKSRGPEADFEFHRSWIDACRRVLKPDGTLWVSGTYHSIYACGYALQLGGWRILNEIAWYKPNAAPHLAGRMFAHSHETLLWARKSEKARHHFEYELMKETTAPQDFLKKPDRQMRSVWAINTPPAGEKKHGKHPTQKPLDLLQRIIVACSERGDLILDPFCGSATTGVAALREGRRFLGFDTEKDYFDKFAIPRLQDIMDELL